MSAALESLMRQTLAPREQRTDRGMVSFLAFGALATAGFIGLSSLVHAIWPMAEGWGPEAACIGAVLLPAYILHRRFSFHAHTAHRQALPRYALVQAMVLAVAFLFSVIVHGEVALPGLQTALLVMALTSGINFMLLKSWVFGRGPAVQASA